MDVKGVGALVTGASEGLGAALARALAREGARVVVVARRPGPLEAVVGEIRAAGGEAHAVPADVGEKREVHRIAGVATQCVGEVGLLVHAASTLGPVPLRPLMDTDCEDVERALAVNLVGPFRLTKAVMGAALLHGRGLVVDVTSDASTEAYPRWGAYGVSKAALDHLGRIWAAETRGMGLRFLTVDPGEMDTRMHADAMPGADRAALPAASVAAERLVALIRRAEALPSGARVELSKWKEAP